MKPRIYFSITRCFRHGLYGVALVTVPGEIYWISPFRCCPGLYQVVAEWPVIPEKAREVSQAFEALAKAVETKTPENESPAPMFDYITGPEIGVKNDK